MSGYLTNIILPMYNEELSISQLRNMFNENTLTLPAGEHRIIIVNDGSTDNTLNLVNKWAQEDSRVKIINHTHNMGVGQAILTGFCDAIRQEADCVVTMDADVSHPAAIINQLILSVQEGADIAIASRFAKGGAQIGVPPLRQVYSFGARVLLSLVFPLKGVRDYTVGFRAYKTSLLAKVLSDNPISFLQFSSFAASVEILLKLAPFADKITEVPLILHYDHKKSPSKLKLWATLTDYGRLFFCPKKKCSLGRGLNCRKNVFSSTEETDKAPYIN